MIKPRVVLIALHFAEYATHLALALSGKWNVLLCVYQTNADNELGEDWPERFINNDVSVVAIENPHSIIAVIKNTAKIISVIAKFKPNVIHFQEGIRDEIIFMLPFFWSVPKVLTVHDPSPHSGTDAKRLLFSRHRLYRYFLRRSVDIVITHGDLMSTLLEKECPWLEGRVKQVPHGPLGAGCPLEIDSKSDSLRLLFFGRINEYKGLRYFVEAVIRLREEGLPVTGVVAGRGNDLERHRSRMESTGYFEILDWYIPCVDISKLFLNARAVILPYTEGTQSGVAAMALFFCRPVVASAVGSIPELVRHNENGLLVPPTEVEALVQAIRSVITDKILWGNLSAGARRLRDTELSWESISVKTGLIYESISIDHINDKARL
jgi:starch synthase